MRRRLTLRVPSLEEQQARVTLMESVTRDLEDEFWSQSAHAERDRPTLQEVLAAMEDDRRRGIPIPPDEEVGDYIARRNKAAHAAADERARLFAANRELRARAIALVKADILRARIRKARRIQRPQLHGIVQFADWLPLELRKRVKALAGDYDAEIGRLHDQGRYRVARWNRALAWIYALWYVLRSPVDRIMGLLVKAFTGK